MPRKARKPSKLGGGYKSKSHKSRPRRSWTQALKSKTRRLSKKVGNFAQKVKSKTYKFWKRHRRVILIGAALVGTAIVAAGTVFTVRYVKAMNAQMQADPQLREAMDVVGSLSQEQIEAASDTIRKNSFNQEELERKAKSAAEHAEDRLKLRENPLYDTVKGMSRAEMRDLTKTLHSDKLKRDLTPAETEQFYLLTGAVTFMKRAQTIVGKNNFTVGEVIAQNEQASIMPDLFRVQAAVESATNTSVFR